MENKDYENHIKYIKEISNLEYLKFTEINANQSKQKDHYLIWLNAGVIAIAYPQILNLIVINNSSNPVLLLLSVICLIISLSLCFRNLYLSTRILDIRTATLAFLRINGTETENLKKNDTLEDEYRTKAKFNIILIAISFISGISLLILFITLNYKLINVQETPPILLNIRILQI